MSKETSLGGVKSELYSVTSSETVVLMATTGLRFMSCMARVVIERNVELSALAKS